MAILWVGGEDVDFPTGVLQINTGSSNYRSGYARCAIASITKGSPVKSNVLGAVTSFWLACRYSPPGSYTSSRIIGLVKSGTTAGIWIGISASSYQLALYKTTDGAAFTQVAAEIGFSLGGSTIHRIDVQVASWGATCTVTVYVDGARVIAPTVIDFTSTGVANLDQVALDTPSSSAGAGGVSEIILADTDTRTQSVVTLAPSAAGDATTWTQTTAGANGYQDINETSINDANEWYTNTITQDAQVNLTDMPAGTFSIKAVKIAARMAKSSGATAGSIGLGVKTGGTINSATAVAQATAWATGERLMAVNPVTGVAFTPAEITALQLNFRSAA